MRNLVPGLMNISIRNQCHRATFVPYRSAVPGTRAAVEAFRVMAKDAKASRAAGMWGDVQEVNS